MIYVVKGNTIRDIGLPLQLLTVEQTGETITNYYPSDSDVIEVNMVGAYEKETMDVTVNENYLHWSWTPAKTGCYGIEVKITQEDGTKMRSYRKEQICVVCANEQLPDDDGTVEFVADYIVLDSVSVVWVQGEPGQDADIAAATAATTAANEAAALANQKAALANSAAETATDAASTVADAVANVNTAIANTRAAINTANNAASSANASAANADAATTAANNAAELANTKAGLANTAATTANTAATNANNKAGLANTAATAANDAAELANTKAGLANTAATAANDAAELANTKAGLANTAATAANDAAELANTKAGLANTAATAANDAAELANTKAGLANTAATAANDAATAATAAAAYNNELNISAIYPTDGTDGGNTYTFANAIAKVPSDSREVGLKVTFISDGSDTGLTSGSVYTYQYVGSSWTSANFQIVPNGLEDSLNSSDTDKALAAAQGKVLNEKIAPLTNIELLTIGESSESIDIISSGIRVYGDKTFSLTKGEKYTLSAEISSAVANYIDVAIYKNSTALYAVRISAGSTSAEKVFYSLYDYENCRISIYSSSVTDVLVTLSSSSMEDRLLTGNIVAGLDKGITSSAISSELPKILGVSKVLLTPSTVSGWKLIGNGSCDSDQSYQLKKYAVSEGMYIYIKASKDSDGVFQFQSSSSVPSGINSNLVLEPVNNAVDGFAIVPAGATYLIVSQLSSNTTNEVSSVEIGHDVIVSELFGESGFTMDFGSSSVNAYTSRYGVFDVVTGHEYHVDIETTDNVSVTYFSTRIDTQTTVQTTLAEGAGSRSFSFTATGDASLIALTYRNAGTGSTFNLSITDLTAPSISRNYIEIEKLKSVQNGGIPMPTYAKEEQERVYGLLCDRSMGNVFISAFNTDQHFSIDNDQETYTNPKWVMQGVQAMLNIANLLPLDQIVFGGDSPGYDGSTSSDEIGIIQTTAYLLQPTHDVNSIVVSIPGNHDAYQNNANVTAQSMHNINAKRNERHAYYHGNGTDNCDAYIDYEEHNIRTIFVDTYSQNGRTEDFRTFLTGALSSMPENYMALIYSHNPLTNEFAGVVKAQSLSGGEDIDAFQNPSDCHAILNEYADRIIACINGHTHCDVWAVSSSNILYIETTTAAPHTRNYTFDGIPNASTLNTVTDTSYDFFVIDQSAKTIEALRYGEGCNRKWIYKGSGIGQVSGYPQTIVR